MDVRTPKANRRDTLAEGDPRKEKCEKKRGNHRNETNEEVMGGKFEIRFV